MKKKIISISKKILKQKVFVKLFYDVLKKFVNHSYYETRISENNLSHINRFFSLINNIKGVVQVGANSGQEITEISKYTKNIILIEPIPHLANLLKVKYPDYLIISCALGHTNCEMDLYLSSNNGESSSLLKPLKHTEYYPNIFFENKIKVPVRRFDTIISDLNINIDSFNVLITDTQGYDLKSLMGFGDYLKKFDLIMSEYINSNLYENDDRLDTFIDYLNPLGFELVYTNDENLGAGNAVFRNRFSKNIQ